MQVLIRMEQEDVDLVDRAAERGKVSRSAWIRSVLRQAALRHLTWRELPPLQLDPQADQAIIIGDNT